MCFIDQKWKKEAKEFQCLDTKSIPVRFIPQLSRHFFPSQWQCAVLGVIPGLDSTSGESASKALSGATPSSESKAERCKRTDNESHSDEKRLLRNFLLSLNPGKMNLNHAAVK